MSVARLDNRAARALFLDRHALAEPPAGAGKGADLQALIERLGFVQLDSVNTVARAHDLILFARRPAYRPENLTRHYERERSLFEHWTHDSSVIPLAYYPHWQVRFARNEATLKERWRNWQGEAYHEHFEPVLTLIRENGPVCAADVGGDEKKGGSGWWDWHPSKAALEYLWHTGALTVVGRDSFRKRYDLTERVIEETLRSHCPDPDETIDWCCNAAIDRLGFATSGEIAAFWATVTPQEAKDWCAAEVAAGRLEPLKIECADGSERAVLARPGTAESAAALPPVTGRLRVLSPFDPALRDRKRAERLFGFYYRIEIFVPEAKRQYGYYVFPLMEGDRLVGRIDMKAQRDSDLLNVTALWPERGVAWGAGRQQRLEAELGRICRLAGVSRVAFADGWLRAAL